ncbi:MAG: hypothetical protein IJU04_05130, partial [Ruminococcus sp.]|nr:hypothetical protein [Ruminococcus sp.]
GETVLFNDKQLNVYTEINIDESKEPEPSFMEQICGTYNMDGKGVLKGVGVTYSDTGTQESDISFVLTIADAGNGRISITTNSDGAIKKATAAIDENSKYATFTVEYGYGYNYNCSLKFDISGTTVTANMHMHVDGEDWNGEAQSEDITVSGIKK